MIKRKRIVVSAILGASLLILSACSAGAPAKTEGPAPAAETAEVKVTHELGETAVSKEPKRVVIFDYALLDLLDNMDVEIVGLPKANIPPLLSAYGDEKYENVGTLQEPDFEKVFALEPDLILISTRTVAHYEELSKIAPTLYMAVDNDDYLASVEKNALTLGEIFNKTEVVEEKVASLKERAAAIREKASSLEENALVLLANDGSLSAYGPGSRFGFLYGDLGMKPADPGIEVSTHGQSVTFEYVLEKDADYIFVVDRAGVVGGTVTAESMFENDIVKRTKAYAEDRIIYLDPFVWYVTSGGITGTEKMLDEVEEALNKK